MLLTKEEIEWVRDICRDISENPTHKRRVSADFRDFAFKMDGTDQAKSYNLSRLFAGSSVPYETYVFFYEFMTTEYRRALQIHDARGEIGRKIDKLVEFRGARLADDEELSVMRGLFSEGGDPENIPRGFLGDYLGYRLSSNKGEIIRFSISIRDSGAPHRVRFKNYYDRDGFRWLNSGIGFFNNGTLYMIGHARDVENSLNSRGNRFFAVERWNDNDILVGVLISRDKIGPIAARVALIPERMHKFEQSNYKDVRVNVANRNAKPTMMDNPARALSLVLERDKMMYDQGRYHGDVGLEQYILEQTEDALQSCAGDFTRVSLWDLIINLTNTTLHGYAPRLLQSSAFDRSGAREQDFEELVTRLVNMSPEARVNPSSYIQAAVADYLASQGANSPPAS